ncbi:hypothetical protein [Fervidibacillus albus]|uniref:Aldose 1-epimerase n=1 Tax=Fervidibacillus albus TaxID=2980026 RepID=A0A9E8RU70_9BACI|nr:hypothetical protein [Fervidibacillus albus]WAA08925.1 hypothetical protein OE104_09940 [Fervidibacillus albus]
MFYIKRKNVDGMLRIECSNETGDTRMEIIPERGAIISDFVVKGEKVFYLNNETLIDKRKNVRGGNPILFPICGPLDEGRYEINGNAYFMKQHGFARNQEWMVIREEASDERAKVTLQLKDNKETYAQYPFHFQLQLTYTLDEGGLDIKVTVKNEDEKPMPFSFGFHPYFYVADKNRVSIEIPSTDYENVIPESFVNEKWNFEQDEINVKFQRLMADECRLVDLNRSLSVRLKWDDPFRYIVVWTLKDQSFICVEPWTAFVNALNSNQDLSILKSGEERELSFSIQVEKE